MSKFQVRQTCELHERQLFVMTGCVVEGEVQPGMWVNVPCSEVMTLRAPILCVETVPQSGSGDVRLHVQAELGRILREDGVEIRDHTIEITPTRIKPKGTFSLHDLYEMRALGFQEFKCNECGLLLEPDCDRDGPVGEDLLALAENAKRLGWYAPAVEPDGTMDLVTCYCPACAQQRGLKAGETPAP